VKVVLSRVEDEPLSFSEELEIEAEDLDGSRCAEAARVEISGQLTRSGTAVTATGRVRASARLLCTRCLEPVPWQEEEEFELELRPRHEEPHEEEIELESEDLDVVYLDDEVLDLAQLAAEQVLLALPMKVLCREDCKGLCPRCGGSLNQADGCSCEPEVDPRWDALKTLKDQIGES